MKQNIYRKCVFVGITFLLLANIFLLYKLFFQKRVIPPSLLPPQEKDIPVTFRTEGGLLEVAGMVKQEDFLQADNLKWWFVSWGTTISQIRVEATYRYHVRLSDEWNVRIKDSLCIVEAPSIEPTLPVAIDTEKTVHKTARGWARFNKEENLELLRKSVSGKLATHAQRAEYVNLIREPARKTIEEFIAAWLLKEHLWGDSEWHMIKVVFPDEKRGEYQVGFIDADTEIMGVKSIRRPHTTF